MLHLCPIVGACWCHDCAGTIFIVIICRLWSLICPWHNGCHAISLSISIAFCTNSWLKNYIVVQQTLGMTLAQTWGKFSIISRYHQKSWHNFLCHLSYIIVQLHALSGHFDRTFIIMVLLSDVEQMTIPTWKSTCIIMSECQFYLSVFTQFSPIDNIAK
jgi:hypothetical protein